MALQTGALIAVVEPTTIYGDVSLARPCTRKFFCHTA